MPRGLLQTARESSCNSDAERRASSRPLRLAEYLQCDLLEAVVDCPLTGELCHRPGLQDKSSRVIELTMTRTGLRAQQEMHCGLEPEAECLALGVRRTRHARTLFVTVHRGGPPKHNPRQRQVGRVAQLLA